VVRVSLALFFAISGAFDSILTFATPLPLALSMVPLWSAVLAHIALQIRWKNRFVLAVFQHYAMVQVYVLFFILLICSGPGRFSVDYWLAGKLMR